MRTEQPPCRAKGCMRVGQTQYSCGRESMNALIKVDKPWLSAKSDPSDRAHKHHLLAAARGASSNGKSCCLSGGGLSA